MTTYSMYQQGYMPYPLGSDFEVAREAFKLSVKDSLARAKRVSPQARKHKLTSSCYRITLGSDKNSTLYSHFTLIKES